MFTSHSRTILLRISCLSSLQFLLLLASLGYSTLISLPRYKGSSLLVFLLDVKKNFSQSHIVYVILLHRVRCNNLRSFFFVSSACARVWLLFNGLFALLCVGVCVLFFFCQHFWTCVDLAKVIKKSTTNILTIAFVHRTFQNHA